MGGYVAAAQLGYQAMRDYQARNDASRAAFDSQTAAQQQFPYELMQLRQNYGEVANQMLPSIYSGGFGNYGNYNPYQQGQSPFAQYSQPQNQQTTQQSGGRFFDPSGGIAPQDGKLQRDQQQIQPINGKGRGGYVTGGNGDSYFNSDVSQSNNSPFNVIDRGGTKYEMLNNSGSSDGAGSYPSKIPRDWMDTSNYYQNIDPNQAGNPNQPVPTSGVNPYSTNSQQPQSQLSLLSQAGQVNYNPQIDQIVGQQGQNIQNNQPLNFQNIQNLQNQLGGINQNSNMGLQQLINQTQGNNNNIQSLFNQQAGQQGMNNPQAQSYQDLLGVGKGFANGQQNLGDFGQFSNAVGSAIGNNQQNINGIDQQTQALIDANSKSSQFEQDKAIQDLNDQLAARGLTNSQAGTEAISNAMAQFSRQRATDEAKIRQDALNTGFQQRLQGNNLQGQLAGQGAGILAQQGQLGNSDLNSRINALNASGNLVQGQGNQQSQGIGNLLQLLQANQGGIGQANGLQNQMNQQNAGFAQANYGLNQQGINSQNDSLNQVLALYGQNEQRNMGIGQQAFANRGALYDRGSNMVGTGFGAGNTQALANQQIQANSQMQQNGFNQANRAGTGQLIGAGLGLANEFYQGYQQNNNQAPQNYGNMYPSNVNGSNGYQGTFNSNQSNVNYNDPNAWQNGG